LARSVCNASGRVSDALTGVVKIRTLILAGPSNMSLVLVELLTTSHPSPKVTDTTEFDAVSVTGPVAADAV
jgi:hypothetical protein